MQFRIWGTYYIDISELQMQLSIWGTWRGPRDRKFFDFHYHIIGFWGTWRVAYHAGFEQIWERLLKIVSFFTEPNDVDHVEVDDVEYLGHLVVGHRGEERAVVVEGDVLDVPEVRAKVLHELKNGRRSLLPVES